MTLEDLNRKARLRANVEAQYERRREKIRALYAPQLKGYASLITALQKELALLPVEQAARDKLAKDKMWIADTMERLNADGVTIRNGCIVRLEEKPSSDTVEGETFLRKIGGHRKH